MYHTKVTYRPTGDILIAEFDAETLQDSQRLAEEHKPEGYSVYRIDDFDGDFHGVVCEILSDEEEHPDVGEDLEEGGLVKP